MVIYNEVNDKREKTMRKTTNKQEERCVSQSLSTTEKSENFSDDDDDYNGSNDKRKMKMMEITN